MPKFAGYYWRDGWSDKLPFYSFKCKIHGQVVNYPSGYNERLDCPLCVREQRYGVKE